MELSNWEGHAFPACPMRQYQVTVKLAHKSREVNYSHSQSISKRFFRSIDKVRLLPSRDENERYRGVPDIVNIIRSERLQCAHVVEDS